MKKINLYFIGLILFFNCSNYSPNERQFKNVMNNIKLYELLIKKIETDTKYQNKILEKRKEKLRGDGDLITTKNEYRLIEIKELIEISNDSIKNILNSLKKEYCLKGIRYNDSKNLIIEINDFNRRTLNQKYTRFKTLETHRIVKSDTKIDYTKFSNKRDSLKWINKLRIGWNYRISQLNH